MPVDSSSSLVVLVVDGATGAGRVLGTRLSASGAAVAVVTTATTGNGVAFLSRELAELGRIALPYRLDTNDPAGRATLLAEVSADLGLPDIVVNLTGDPELSLCAARLMSASGRGGRIVHGVPESTPTTAVPPWYHRPDGQGEVILTLVTHTTDPSRDRQASADQEAAAAVLRMLGR